jgi:hypothetical protein
MKLAELFESDPLEDLEKLMLLRSTESRISQEQAEKVSTWLKENGYKVLLDKGGNKDEYSTRRHLKISSTSWRNPTWKSGRGAVERYQAEQFLKANGFMVGRREASVILDLKTAIIKDATKMAANSQHVYFW